MRRLFLLAQRTTKVIGPNPGKRSQAARLPKRFARPERRWTTESELMNLRSYEALSHVATVDEGLTIAYRGILDFRTIFGERRPSVEPSAHCCTSSIKNPSVFLIRIKAQRSFCFGLPAPQ